MPTSTTNRPTYYRLLYVIIVIASLAFATGSMFFETIFQCNPSFGVNTNSILFFLARPLFLLWVFMAMIQIVFALSVLPFVFQKIAFVITTYNVKRNTLIINALVIVCFVAIILYMQSVAGNPDVPQVLTANKLMSNAFVKMRIIICCSYAAAAVCSFLILLVNAVLNDLNGTGIELYTCYRTIKVMMQNVLNILGFIITTSTVATVLLQKAVFDDFKTFTPPIVYSYGLFNTFYIAIIYLPVFFNLRATGRKLADMELKADAATLQTPEQYLAKKKTLDEIFALDEDYVEVFKKAIPILAPLLASLFAMK